MTDTPAPPNLTRLRLIECEANPRHPDLYYEYNEDEWYPPPCYMCIIHEDTVRKQIAEHARHRAWHRWRIVRWLIAQAYMSGLAVSGGGHTWGGYGGCNGCLTSWPKFRRGSRYYVLWLETWKWRCLRRGHLPGDFIGFGMCAKCLPCPDCGSKRAAHNEGCEWNEYC